MEKKIIRVEIKDGGSKKTFSVRLFGAFEGMEFLDRLLKSGQEVSIMNIAKDLLPLASIVDQGGQVIDTLSIDKVDTYFESPLAVYELAYKIFQHQMVFMNESETFRKFAPAVQNLFNMPISGSATK